MAVMAPIAIGMLFSGMLRCAAFQHRRFHTFSWWRQRQFEKKNAALQRDQQLLDMVHLAVRRLFSLDDEPSLAPGLIEDTPPAASYVRVTVDEEEMDVESRAAREQASASEGPAPQEMAVVEPRVDAAAPELAIGVAEATELFNIIRQARVAAAVAVPGSLSACDRAGEGPVGRRGRADAAARGPEPVQAGRGGRCAPVHVVGGLGHTLHLLLPARSPAGRARRKRALFRGGTQVHAAMTG
jgi:hypothetical protein